MDGATLLTAVGCASAIVGTNIALIGWLRADMKSFETEVRGWKDDFRKEMSSYKDEIHKEMKDFHGRLVEIETKNKIK